MPDNPSRILIVAATEKELQGTQFHDLSNVSIDTLITGVGMVATAHALTRKLVSGQFDMVIGIGIAGSFNTKFEIGDVVQVTSDRLVELGVEDHDTFVPADEMDLMDSEQVEFFSDVKLKGLRSASGITVNCVHGNAESISRIVEQFNPDVESMEGAAVAFVCEQFRIPWVQMRAVSNKVEPRNKTNWNIPLALKNLHGEVEKQLKLLNNEA